MKKIEKLLGLLLLTGVLFFGCDKFTDNNNENADNTDTTSTSTSASTGDTSSTDATSSSTSSGGTTAGDSNAGNTSTANTNEDDALLSTATIIVPPSEEIVLSNGNWEVVSQTAYSDDQVSENYPGLSCKLIYKERVFISIANGNKNATKATYSITYIYNVPESYNEEDIQEVREFIKIGATPDELRGMDITDDQLPFTISVDGNTITINQKQETEADAQALLSLNNPGSNEYETLYSMNFPANAVVKRNSDKTLYVITFTQNDDNGDEIQYVYKKTN